MGYVQVYTGDGKGKTTASLGLLLRAVGAGLAVRVFQFMKHGETCECAALADRFPEVEVTPLGSGRFINPRDIPAAERARAADGFGRAAEAVRSGAFDLVILDEINGAMDMGLIPVEDVLRLMRDRPSRTELVLTGRGAPQAVVDAADLCTEMRMVKHYYQKGVPARRGIER
ncbi:MAG: cob(I)yrinic acid a,c-diamide adenosyltransferase [Firmicutes bacterium]|nr:cob(I)yrinic acid a,c-diamide adenosyltransferase [Bacillota bacterium]